MALTDPKSTLAYHNSRVFTAHRDMSDVPVEKVSAAVAAYMAKDKAPNTGPESEALWFYALNHGLALIRSRRAPLEPLSEWEQEFVETYHSILGPKAVRAFYYLLLICTRESRHNKSLPHDLAKIEAKFGPEVAQFIKSSGGAESKIHKALLEKPPVTTIGDFVKCLQWQFYHSKWSPGYGGKAWGKVTDCLVSFVTGEYSAEMMMDTVWTLSHNNGPIFNKGHLYGMYNSHKLLRILDIQRSGQIPQAIATDSAVAHYAHPDLVKIMAALAEHFPEINGVVDWFKVEALGAVGHYPQEKMKQATLTPEGLAKLKAEQEAAAELAAEKAAKKAQAEKLAAEMAAISKAEFEKKHFQIMPELWVEKIIRKEAA